MRVFRFASLIACSQGISEFVRVLTRPQIQTYWRYGLVFITALLTLLFMAATSEAGQYRVY